MENVSAGWRGKFAGFALALAILAVIWFMAAALGTKFGLWGWEFGLGKMIGNMRAGMGRFLIIASFVLSVVAVIVSLIRSPRKKPFLLAIGALLVSGLLFGRWMAFQLNALRLPPIHDVQTNWDAPIIPSEALVELREKEGAKNPILKSSTIPEFVEANWPGMGGRLVSEVQEEAEFNPETQKKSKNAPYPNIETLALDVAPTKVFDATVRALSGAGLELVTQDKSNWQIEGTATTGWFGFKDDVMVRLTPSADLSATLVDMRSTSRVGLSDLGANAKRVRNLLDDIERIANE